MKLAESYAIVFACSIRLTIPARIPLAFPNTSNVFAFAELVVTRESDAA
jgi:hypothetical protein